MKYATIDTKGNPTAFYDSEIHGSDIPKDAVKISDTDWQSHINGQRKVYDSETEAWVDYVPSATEVLNQVKEVKLSEIKSAYGTEISADIQYMNTTFQADRESQVMITKVLAASGGTLPTGFYWLDSSNNKITMTYDDLQGLANAILLRNQQLFDKYQTLKQQINSATTVDELEVIKW